MYDFDAIYQEFHHKIYRYLSHILRSESDAVDLTQAVFLKVSQSLPQFKGDSSYATWLYKIATNTAHDHARSGKTRQQQIELHADEAGPLSEFPDTDSPDTDEEYIRREMNACIRGVVNELPERFRTVLILSDFEGLSNAEIAEVVGESIATVKIRLHRSRAALRKVLECQCTLYHDQRNELMCDRKQKF